jgi:signal transduction histidine kinase
MLLVLASNLTAELLHRATRHLADRAVLLPASDTAEALDIARRLPVALVLANMTPLTADRLTASAQIAAAAPDAVFCCVATEPVKEQIKVEQLLEPDFWLDPEATEGQMTETLIAAVDKTRLRADAVSASPPPDRAQLPATAASDQTEQEVFRRLLSTLATESEPDRLLTAYADAAAELVRCTSHCLLVRAPEEGHFVVHVAYGLHSGIVVHGRLLRDDPLLTWYDRNCRVLTAEELDAWPEPRQAAAIRREMGVFRGQVVVPLIVAGRLDGLLMLGQRVLGDSYTGRELETLFSLSRHVGVQLESLRHQRQHHHLSTHMQRSIAAMDSGLISLGSDQRIVLCNPAAARILQLRCEDIEGADLRCLPSPLGDRLYAAFGSSGAEVTDEQLRLTGLDIWVSLSTFRLQNDAGEAFGAAMVLQDVTDALAEQERNAEQASLELIGDLVGRITHSVRTPMTAIRTYGQLMGEDGSAPELAHFWHDSVTPELERLDHLLDQLVQLVQQPEPSLQLVDLESLVVDAIRKISGNESGLRAAPVLRITTPVPHIVVDPAHTREALSYLLRYLEATDESPVTVFVDQQHDADGNSARIRMRKAAGSSDLTAEQLFDPLIALRQPLADLGPVISRQIVDRQGGTIEARNEDGGIEVTIAFPVAVSDMADGPEGMTDGQI